MTLRLLGGLSTQEAARAFLVSEAAMAQRIVRAKRTLAEHRVPFVVPQGEEIAARLESVLEVIYLIFNEGYAAAAGDDWTRPALCEEAMRLGRVLAELAPREAEVHGLVALMEIQASRLLARKGTGGEPMLSLDQDRSRWDWLPVRHGLAALDRCAAVGWRARRVCASGEHCGVSCKGSCGGADGLEKNCRVVYGVGGIDRVTGGGDGAGDGGCESLWRGDLLFQLGRKGEARREFARAAEPALNATERSMLLKRMEECV